MVGTLRIVIMITVLSPLPSSPLSVRSFEKSNSLNLILVIGNIILMLKIVHKKMVMLTIWLLNIDCLFHSGFSSSYLVFLQHWLSRFWSKCHCGCLEDWEWQNGQNKEIKLNFIAIGLTSLLKRCKAYEVEQQPWAWDINLKEKKGFFLRKNYSQTLRLCWVCRQDATGLLLSSNTITDWHAILT